MESSVDNSALLSLKAKDEYDDKDDAVDNFPNAPMDDCADELQDNVAANQFSDSDDMDDDDLLTDRNDEPVITTTELAPKTVGGEINDQSAAFNDDDDFSDEDLLTD